MSGPGIPLISPTDSLTSAINAGGESARTEMSSAASINSFADTALDFAIQATNANKAPATAAWTPNPAEQQIFREVAQTTDDPDQFASMVKEKVAEYRAENSGSDDLFKGSPYDQWPEMLDQYLTEQFKSTELSLKNELADQSANLVK